MTNRLCAGFTFAATPGTTVRGGYGTYYDRIVPQIQSLERGLDGRALPVEVKAGNVFFVDQATGRFPPFAPTLSNPFTGFILPGAGASGTSAAAIGKRMRKVVPLPGVLATSITPPLCCTMP